MYFLNIDENNTNNNNNNNNNNIIDDNGCVGGDNIGSSKNSSFINLYKTKLCVNYNLWNWCPYGFKCQFAHGVCELRNFITNTVITTTNCYREEKDDGSSSGSNNNDNADYIDNNTNVNVENIKEEEREDKKLIWSKTTLTTTTTTTQITTKCKNNIINNGGGGGGGDIGFGQPAYMKRCNRFHRGQVCLNGSNCDYIHYYCKYRPDTCIQYYNQGFCLNRNCNLNHNNQ